MNSRKAAAILFILVLIAIYTALFTYEPKLNPMEKAAPWLIEEKVDSRADSLRAVNIEIYKQANKSSREKTKRLGK